MKLNCIVIDDEPWALELIKKYVNKMPVLHLISGLGGVPGAVELLQNNDVDLLFIDINIPNGIELLRSLTNKPITIFTTAYKKYAIKGFELGVLDYLLKPVDFERFANAVSRAMELYKFRLYAKHRQADFLMVRSGHSVTRIRLDEIEYIEGCVDYIRIHILNEKPVLTLMSLKAVIEKLPPGKFQRIHRSYIVAVHQIKTIQNKKVLLFSLKELPVSDSYSGFNPESI